jgi:D-alanine--poly(phosphoribitol) ligase subunit 1
MRFLEKTPIDNWVGTPSFADYCLGMSAFNSDRVSSPKRFFFCGEVLRPATVRQLYDRFPTALVYNMYGPTEACCAVTSTLITRAMSLSSPSLSCGKPYPTIEIAIDRADNTRPSDMGEVMLMGTQVARGYLGTPHSDKFAERDGRRSYRTGDLGILINGELYVAGRLDRQVKVNGYRVELAEIEFAIRALGAPDAAVVQLSDGTLKAYVREMSATNVRNGLRRKFPTYMVPKRIVRLDSFPLSANGKVDLQALRVM